MKSICDEEIKFVRKALGKGRRMDGREENEIRRFSLTKGETVVQTANGSARLLLPGQVEILVGIKSGRANY